MTAKSAKGLKANRQAHTSNSKIGMGDNHGVGMKNPMGKMRSGDGMQILSRKQIGTPPKKLA